MARNYTTVKLMTFRFSELHQREYYSSMFERHFREMFDWTEEFIPGAELWVLKGQVQIPTHWRDFNDDGPTQLSRTDSLEYYFLKIPNNRLLQWMLLWKHLECLHHFSSRRLNNTTYRRCNSFEEFKY